MQRPFHKKAKSIDNTEHADTLKQRNRDHVMFTMGHRHPTRLSAYLYANVQSNCEISAMW